jgi:hypothetical protein
LGSDQAGTALRARRGHSLRYQSVCDRRDDAEWWRTETGGKREENVQTSVWQFSLSGCLDLANRPGLSLDAHTSRDQAPRFCLVVVMFRAQSFLAFIFGQVVGAKRRLGQIAGRLQRRCRTTTVNTRASMTQSNRLVRAFLPRP